MADGGREEVDQILRVIRHQILRLGGSGSTDLADLLLKPDFTKSAQMA